MTFSLVWVLVQLTGRVQAFTEPQTARNHKAVKSSQHFSAMENSIVRQQKSKIKVSSCVTGEGMRMVRQLWSVLTFLTRTISVFVLS